MNQIEQNQTKPQQQIPHPQSMSLNPENNIVVEWKACDVEQS